MRWIMYTCEWDNRIEQDKCGACGIVPDVLFWVVPDRDEHKGVYRCKPCADGMIREEFE